ncbi:MAG TPA: glycosyltransferase family 4 protein [Candidatus Dormibacteraeota bacterium]|nr:glycosyltransferase family 4 protein [Candidatus Dormibacteraeota bacterium]
MLTHSYYEEDPRVRREAESLVGAGRAVHVYGLRRPGDAPADVIDGVDLHRIDVQRHQGAGLGTYLREYLSFFLRAGWAATSEHRRRRYALLQVHTLPDFLVFAGVPLRLAGVPLLLDLHEAMPEFFRIRFPRASGRLAHASLLAQERASIAVADAALTVNDALKERLVRLGVPARKVTVIRNTPSLARFDPARQPVRAFAEDGCLRLVYAGALSPVYELDVVLDALRRLRAERPALDAHLDLYGRDFAEVPLADRAAALGVGEAVTLHGRIPIEAVPAALAAADIGLAPTRRSEMTDFSLSTKVFEYAAMGKPVVASRLPMVERTFPPGTVATYEPGDAESLATAVLALVDRPEERAARVARTLELVRDLSWEREAERYHAVVEALIASRRPS